MALSFFVREINILLYERSVSNMIKIVKNKGQCKHFRSSKCKYLFYTDDFSIGKLYAKPGLKPIKGYVLAKIKGGFS